MSVDLARTTALALTLVAAGCGRFHFEALPGGDGGGDDGGDAALPPGSCNAVDRFADDFEDGVQGPLWNGSYANPGTSYAETGGELVLTLAPNATNSYLGYSSTYFYDLRNHRMSAELVPQPNGGVVAGLAAQYIVSQYIHVSVKDGFTIASEDVAGTYSTRMTIPYSPVMHRFLALEEQSGQLMFETSADGVTFTPFFQEADAFDLSLVQPQLYAGTQTPVAAPGVARFASFNGTASGLGGCPIGSLVDHFDDGVPGHEWENSYTDTCCTETESGGVLTINTDGSLGTSARRSSAGYDLREGHIAITVTTPPTGSARASLLLTRANGDNVIYDVRSTLLSASKTIGGTNTTLFSVARAPSERYMQIRESGGTLYLEVSTDRVSWQTRFSGPPPFAVDDVGITVQGGIVVAAGAADSVAFDDLGP